MISKDAHKVKHYLLSDPPYKTKIFKLVWIQSINSSVGENYFKVLFRDIQDKKYLQQYIFPENLSIFTVGSFYKDSLLLNKTPDGEILDINVESTKHNNIQQIDSLITDLEYNLSHQLKGKTKTIDYSDENKRQLCVVLENAKQQIIFPCTVIGSTYYFLSTSMRQQLLAQNLNGLYETITIDPVTKRATIKMKPGAADCDAPHIIRFATNSFAKTRWDSISNSIRNHLKERLGTKFCPIIADFPVIQPLHMTIRGLRFRDNKNSKEKVLVFEILKENSQFSFDEIEIIRDERELSFHIDNTSATAKAHKTTDLLVITAPHSKLRPAEIRQRIGEKNTNIPTITVSKKYSKEGDSETIVIRESASPVDMSVRQPEAAGEEDVRPSRVVQETQKKPITETKEPFTLDDFKTMTEKLKNTPSVTGFLINGPFPMPSRNLKTKKSSYSLREVYSKTTNIPRNYLYLTFTYDGTSACLIEIDQQNLPNGCATYGLISKNKPDFSNNVVDIVSAFARHIKIEDISKAIKRRNIGFFSKNHPAEKNEIYFARWCVEVLGKIKSVS